MQPLISLAALERAFSPERLRAYRLPSDADETDGLARYLWNLALADAIQPALHVLEVAFRNEISRAAAKLTSGRRYAFDRIPSWLDAKPSMLLEHEQAKVARAKEQLGTDPRSQTEGHLIAKLDFGFWVALCRHPYADWRASGPRLWPRTLELAFRARPAAATTQSHILHRFDPVRRFRNRVAHHEPVWDRDYLRQHDYILESIGWMSPKLAEATRVLSPAVRAYERGAEAFRPHAEVLLGTGEGTAAFFQSRLASLDCRARSLVAWLVDAFVESGEEEPRTVAARWAERVAQAA
ncbi:MAG TPA: hypothetical protein VFQ45_15270 [Longimicrobium sp.]|nr:hypothetical protein [Longimicrobium sp.]